MRIPFLPAAAVLGTLASPGPAAVAPSSLVRVSVDSAGAQSNGNSRTCALSADGRWVVFVSAADNLVPDDDNGEADVFLHDRRLGTTTRVSVSSSGEEARLECVSPAVSGDGQMVAFQSDSDTLVDDDTNGFADIFVRDTRLGTTSRVSVATNGTEAELPCVGPAISADGRCVAFQSYATNLGGPQSLGIQDVFVRDLVAGTTDCISRGGHGQLANNSSWAPSLSADGRYVAFHSQASNLVPGDLNGSHDVFVHDRRTGLTELVSLTSTGLQGSGPSLNPKISGDGRFVAFDSFATNMVPFDDNTDSDVFVHDRLTGTTELVSQNTLEEIGNEESESAALSDDGRWVVFHSQASNLSADPDGNLNRDVFLRDRLLGVTTRVTVGLHLFEGLDESRSPAISASGSVIAFDSWAHNLVGLDSNNADDVFVHVKN